MMHFFLFPEMWTHLTPASPYSNFTCR